MKQIHWGILAAGRISGWFCTALRSVKGARLLAVGSRTREKGEEFASRFGIERVYEGYDDLVADPEIDVVYIGVHTRYHYENILRCLRAGKSVVCEKSLTINAAQAEEVIQLAREKKLFLMEAMWSKCLPVYLQVKQWVQEGRIGDIKMFKAEFFTPGKFNPPHRLYNHSIGGGALLDLSVYPVAYICSLLGTPDRVDSAAYIGETNVDVDDSIVLRWDSGAFAHICCGFNIAQENPAVLIGSKGKITIDHNFLSATSAQLRDLNNEIVAEVHIPYEVNGYEYEAQEATRCLLEGRLESPLVPLEETLATMRVLDECRRQWGFRFDFE